MKIINIAIASTLLLCSSLATANIVDDIERQFDFTNGNLVDSVTNASLTSYGGITTTADRFGNVDSALLGDGLTGRLKLLTANADVKQVTGMAVSLWFRLDYASNSNYLYDNREGASPPMIVSAFGDTRIGTMSGSTNPNAYNMDQWTHLFMTNRSSDTGGFQLYVDGALVRDASSNFTTVNVLSAFTLMDYSFGGTSTTYKTQGAIDDVVILSGSHGQASAEFFYADYVLGEGSGGGNIGTSSSDVTAPLALSALGLFMMGLGMRRKQSV